MKKIILLAMILLTSGCTANNSSTEPVIVHDDLNNFEKVKRITYMCSGYARSGKEQGHGTELDIFNFCMNRAAQLIKDSQTMEI